MEVPAPEVEDSNVSVASFVVSLFLSLLRLNFPDFAPGGPPSAEPGIYSSCGR